MLELYHHGTSACAAKVRFAIEEKRLAWTGRYVDILRGEQFTPEFLAVNPKAVVPVLVHDGTAITESTVICEYLEDAFPDPPLYPESPLERARARLWTKAVDEELHPACSAITYVTSHRHTILRNGAGSFEDFMRRGGSEGAAARALKWQWIEHGLAAPGAADKIRLYAAYLDKMELALRDGDWLVGGRFTIADVAMTPYVNRLAALSMDGLWTGARLPRVADWFARVRARPAFAAAFAAWVPAELADEMRANGAKSWPEVAALLGI
ncbi:MAG TPA: glutathione S-transferase N-terminal domain-containing protein [Gammaproteobacteria bacterium]|nr:glutathione S-transferase N-terminal domain-containing protein [Gammaproteobacteria bacterium]